MKKILVVDDREENRIMLANYFRLFGSDAGITVLQAGDSAEAVRLAVENRPDLILMDIKLESDRAGLEATRRIKADAATADIPIWAVTAYAPVSDDNAAPTEKQMCFDAGCSEYICKPFEPTELLKKVSVQLSVPIPEEILKRMDG